MFNTLISTTALKKQIAEAAANLVVVDCRFSLVDTEAGRVAYCKAHIPNAYYVHLDADLSGRIVKGETGRHPLPTVVAASRLFAKLGITADSQVVTYDDGHGGVAARLWWMLNWLGHKKVAVLDGGWAKWQQENLPVSAKIPAFQMRAFIANENPDLIASVEKVENIATTSVIQTETLLVDSREAGRYEGKIEPIDPVAGHIPNAKNIPFLENMAEGVFLTPEALKARFEALLEGQPVAETIFYCGSGVTACHNILALRHANMGMAKLYVGSWSDWITNKNRPIAVSE